MVDVNLSPAEMERQLKDKKWENAQIKGLTSWANTYLAKENMKIETLPEDVMDGVRLGVLCEQLSDGKKMTNAIVMKPKHKIEKIQNANVLLRFCTDQLGIRLVGIGAEDIVNGELKMILGLMWSTFRKLSLGSLSGKGRGSNPEEDLLNWFKEKCQPYGVDVSSFRTSFNDGMAWAAIIDQFDPDYIDFASLASMSQEKVLETVFDVAEKKLGIPRLFEPLEFINDAPDERSITLYSSLFYHAYVTNADKIQLANEKRAVTSSSQDVEGQVKAVREAINALREAHLKAMDLRRQHESAVAESDARLKKLSEEVERLRREKAELERRLRELEEQRRRALNKDLKDMYDEVDQLKKQAAENVGQREKYGAESLSKQDELERMMRRLRNNGLFGLEGRGSWDINNAMAGIGRLSAAGGLDELAAGLRAHVNALHHQWQRAAEEAGIDSETGLETLREAAKFKADHAKLAGELAAASADKKTDMIREAVAPAHETMMKVLAVQDARNEMNKHVAKRGYLMAHKDGKRWKKRWFVLTGFTLDYFDSKDDQDEQSEGNLNLEDSSVTAKDSKDSKLPWLIRIVTTVEAQGEKRKEVLQVAAKTKEDRDDWFFVLQARVMYAQYEALIKEQQIRPDMRIVRLFEMRNLSALSLCDQPLDPQSLKVVEKLVTSHNECQRFAFANSSLDDKCMPTLSGLLQLREAVVGINLAGNSITSDGVSALLDGVRLVNVQDVSMSRNQIDDDGLELLCTALANSPDLYSLDMSYNKISGKAMQEYVFLVKDHPGLTKIQLSHNNIADGPVKEHLASLLTFTSTVKAVDLSFNRIGDDGIKELCNALRESSVKEVNFSGNVFGSSGLAAIHDLMKDNPSIAVLTNSTHRGIISEDVSLASTDTVKIAELRLDRI